MVFLPKSTSSTDNEGRDVYTPENTRPLNITNADNRLMATAVRLRIEPAMANNISHMQRGFLAGRSMLANIIDIDETMATFAVSYSFVGTIFFDFAAAFPSVSHDFLLDYFSSCGTLPPNLIHFILALYRVNHCSISLGGQSFPGFEQTTGIRQGCPLSTLLFVLAADLLLLRLQHDFPHAVIRAFVDDLAVVIPALEDMGRMEPLFDEYYTLSGLALSHRTTVLVPLAEYDEPTLRAYISIFAPGWSDFAIASSAKYLGIYLGPQRGFRSWARPMLKYLERAKIWRKIGGGLHITLQAYRVYVMSVLTFVAQLVAPPPEWEQTERQACQILFPGPTGWMTPPCLKGLKLLGMPMELPQLPAIAQAAQCRVCRYENATHGGLHITTRTARLDSLFSSCPLHDRVDMWGPWPRHTVLHQIHHRNADLLQQDPTYEVTKKRAGQNVDKHRTSWQRACYATLRTSYKVEVARHMRRRLDRWHIPLLPGKRYCRVTLLLKGLAKKTPPRIPAAVLRCLCNGLITSRRYQGRNRCGLGCIEAEDSLEHYAFCPALATIARERLQLERAEPAERLQTLLCLHCPWSDGNMQELLKRAILLYGLAHALNARRHHFLSSLATREALVQGFREAVFNHAIASILH